MDIVRGNGLRRLRGITGLLEAGSLGIFRSPSSPEQARADARRGGVLLYSPAYDFDAGICKDLKKSGGAVVFAFSDLLAERGFRRAIALSKMRLLLSECRKAGAGVVVCTLAQDGDGLRNAREMSAFAHALGLGAHEKAHAAKTAGRLAGKLAVE